MGYRVLFWLQTLHSPPLDLAAELIRFLAEPVAISLVLGFFYWCVDKNAGRRMALVMFSGTTLNAFMKNLLRVERPFRLFPELAGSAPEDSLATATGYSLPSGHTQNAAAFGGLVFARIFRKRRWLGVLCAALFAVLVACSRMYIGAHTPVDVAIGLTLGFGWLFLGSALDEFVQKKGRRLWNLLFLIPAALPLVTLLPLWHDRPPETEDAMMALGLLSGTVFGVILEEFFIGFSTDTTVGRKAVRLCLGLAGALVIYLGFKLLPDNDLCEFVRALLLGLWLTAGLPWLATRLERKGSSPQSGAPRDKTA